MTDDHVPPRSFFPPPLPNNLITVRCCKKCNNVFSLDDEAFLIWITSGAELNQKGRWILTNKIVPKLRKKIKLRDNVRKHIKIEPVQLPSGVVELPLSRFPDERGDRFMVRLQRVSSGLSTLTTIAPRIIFMFSVSGHTKKMKKRLFRI